MSSRQSTANLHESVETSDIASKTRGNLTISRNSRRSNSAMSSTRRKGSASKDESETEQQGELGTSSILKDESLTTAEPEEEEYENENENGESGDSVNSASQTHTRARKKAGGKRRRGGAVGNRSRSGKAATEGPVGEGTEVAGVKSEADEETAQMQPDEDAGEDLKGGEKLTRHRSTSGFKELAGLGLRSLGDGEEEPLVPRRTRRGAVSPNDAESQQKESGEEHESRRPESHEKASKAEEDSAIPQDVISTAGEDETGEEGVTRCLCGSADENVGLMIQCETCKCWQHCICMGMRTEDDCPDVYYCEQCRPELHIPLLRLLSVLPNSRLGKKGGSKGQSGRTSAKDAAKELKEAKEAVLTLAKENERRRKEGREPVTGWSVAQEQEQQQLQIQDQMYQSSGQHRRQISETRVRGSRSGSRDELIVPKSPPKRRSTMNSRDSAYGWESIPPGLLNEEDEWGSKDESENGGRKRRRTGPEEEGGDHHSHSPVGLSSSDGNSKRRRTSSAIDAVDDGTGQKARDEEEDAEEDGEGEREAEELSNTTLQKKSVKTRAPREQETSRPKHPNQYTARRAAAAAAAAAAAGIGNPGSSSPSPSPSKHRLADGSRKTTSLRDVMNNGSRMATPTPNGSQVDYSKSTNPGAPWGMPEHLSHLAYLLPSLTGPEPLIVNLASTKGMPSTSSNKGAPSTATKDSKTDRIIRASPQAFQNVPLVELNTKIKFPGKRTTLGEMRKRVRNILDFVSRLQIESAERERRMRFLGIAKEPKAATVQETLSADSMEQDEPIQVEENKEQDLYIDSKRPEEALQVNDQVDMSMKDVDAEDVSNESNVEPKETLEAPSSAQASLTGPASPSNNIEAALQSIPPPEPTPTLKKFTELYSSSMSLVDELTRELLTFQQRYGTGTSGTSTVMASSSGTY